LEEKSNLSEYLTATENMRLRLRVGKSFDMIERHLTVCGADSCFFYIDGFVKDGEMLRIMQYLISLKSIGDADSTARLIPYVEVEHTGDNDRIFRAVMSGQTAYFAESFGGEAVLIDSRTSPARQTAEPESDRVM
jgi:stage V sporulation protein AF